MLCSSKGLASRYFSPTANPDSTHLTAHVRAAWVAMRQMQLFHEERVVAESLGPPLVALKTNLQFFPLFSIHLFQFHLYPLSVSYSLFSVAFFRSFPDLHSDTGPDRNHKPGTRSVSDGGCGEVGVLQFKLTTLQPWIESSGPSSDVLHLSWKAIDMTRFSKDKLQ